MAVERGTYIVHENGDYVDTTLASRIVSARNGAVSQQVINAWARRGKIDGAVKFENRWLIPREWAETFKMKPSTVNFISEDYMVSNFYGDPILLDEEY